MRITWSVLGLSLTVASPMIGQGTEVCRAVLDHADMIRQRNAGPGRLRHYLVGNVEARCEGQLTEMASDSVAWFEERGRMDLTGNVAFRDTTVTLDADRAIYFLDDERLEAFGNVRLVNLETGTVLTGPELTYWRNVPAVRDTTELYATERPLVEYQTDGDSTGSEPYLIEADHIRMKGEDAAWAGGTVTIDRSDFAAAADSAVLGLGGGNGLLIGNATVAGGDSASFRLAGREITFASENDELNWVQSRDSAEAESADFHITADTVEFALADDLVQGGLAWGRTQRPVAISETQTIVADSLAIDSPDQRLQELRAFGQARATRRADPLEEEDGEVDWIAGDTLVARFDSTDTGERFLRTMTAKGTAMAFYRIYPEGQPVLLPDINYSRGDRITAHFAVAGIRQVDVVGAADGVHLEPIRRRRP